MFTIELMSASARDRRLLLAAVIFGFALLVGANAEAQLVELEIVDGFDVSQAGPVPHVMCRNVDAGEYARSDVYDGLGANLAYTFWRCYSGGNDGLQIAPVAGNQIEQQIHGFSDGTNDPSVDVFAVLQFVDVICHNRDSGEMVTAVATGTVWDCGFTIQPVAGQDIIVTISGTY